jgi:hypothetical protein
MTGPSADLLELVHKARQMNPGLLRLRAAAHIMLNQRDPAEVARAEMMRLECSRMSCRPRRPVSAEAC